MLKSLWIEIFCHKFKNVLQTINFIVSLGQTRASAQVSCSIMEPRATRPNEGMLFIYVEFLPMCSQRFMNKVRFSRAGLL